MEAVATVVRFELWPAEAPEGYAVGFDVNIGGRGFYVDVVVPMADAKGLSHDEIAREALSKLSSLILDKKKEAAAVPPAVGLSFRVDDKGLVKRDLG